MRRMRLPGFSLFCAFSDRLFTRMRMRAARLLTKKPSKDKSLLGFQFIYVVV